MATGLLIRVGMDSTEIGGKGYSFCKSNGEFFYLPIPENKRYKCDEKYEKLYDLFEQPLCNFTGKSHKLLSGQCHLDPDFGHMTYGDSRGRANRIKSVFLDKNSVLKPDSFIAFYAALKPVDDESSKKLIYALIGFYYVESILSAKEVTEENRDKNAHTRRIDYKNIYSGEDVIVFAKRNNQSGRLKRYIEIGNYRQNAYRVNETILENWGGLSVTNGYLQRSAYLPEFSTPEKFLEWFHGQSPDLIHGNNLL